ncbi:UNVERIFIED_CONTAM: hypothetical protein Slati_0136800 [Sesamum latifolium]|uniref:Uncharacterized protein n=1 Tax=Sesamum latifolium TaxID=2727402 RepID=A0AAW2Y9L7_9LAMI
MELVVGLGVPILLKHDKYAVSPVFGASKLAMFNDIKDWIRREMPSWSSRKRSEASYLVMIKSVLQAIPMYAMSCFKLPEVFIGEVDRLLAAFFSHQDGGRKIHWLAWCKVCRGK